MQPTTIRLRADTLEQLDTEYGEYGYGDRSEYIRAIVDHRDPPYETTPNTRDYGRPTTEDYGRLRDRVDELEERLERVESEDRPSGPANPRPDPQGSDVEDVVGDALSGWSHGRSDEERRSRRESVELVFDWMRDHRTAVSKRDVIDEFGDDIETDQTAETWWAETVLGALKHAVERGYVEDEGRSYRWVGVS